MGVHEDIMGESRSICAFCINRNGNISRCARSLMGMLRTLNLSRPGNGGVNFVFTTYYGN